MSELKHKVRMLVAYSTSSTHVQTTINYLISFKIHTEYEINYVHVTHDAVMNFDINDYDIIFHNYCSRFCFDNYVSNDYRKLLRDYSGLKIISVQDEYDHTEKLKEAIREIDFDVVLTCVPQDSLSYVYPKSEFPRTEFITVFTGYVPDDFARTAPAPKPLSQRPIFIGYRGRDIGGRYGRLGFDKFEIGRRMKQICDARGIETDIAMDEASRIYGPAWFDFIGDCRAMLGSESGSNVFDFDGSIDTRFREMATANGGRSPSYDEFLPIVARRDGEIDMGQISPRVFECALMRTPMVLFRGRYSDAIEADKHYIPLEKDFSNVDEVLDRLHDLPALEAMTGRAYEHLVASGDFGYRAFCGRVAEAIDRHLAARGLRSEPSRPLPEPADPKERILAERPTDFPQPHDNFHRKQLRLVGLTYAAEVERIDAIYQKAVTDCVSSANYMGKLHRGVLKSLRRSLPEAVIDNSREKIGKAAGKFSIFSKLISKERDLYYKQIEQYKFNSLKIEKEIVEVNISELNRDWLKRYVELYRDFHANFDRLYSLINENISELDSIAGMPIKDNRAGKNSESPAQPKGAPWHGLWFFRRLHIRIGLGLARARGSWLEVAKQKVRRSPVLASCARLALRTFRPFLGR